MLDALANSLIAAALVVAAVTAVLAYLRRPTPLIVAVGVVLVAAAVVVQAVIAVVLLIEGQRPQDVPTFIGYLLFSVLILPAGLLWARADPGRGGNGVLAVAGVTVAVMVVRMGRIWGMAGG